MHDISGFGFRVNVKASNTFPQGFNVTQFADDADPFDTPAVQLADKKMGLNGDLIVWSTANAIEVTINVVPGSDDDKNLSILADANRVAANKQSARDIITLTGIYPSGKNVVLTVGKIMSGPVSSSVASAGRLKSKPYMFAFEQKTGAPG